MSENLRMDSHKLIYHPKRVSEWLTGKNIYPIEIEIAPSGACNQRCIFCAVDYMGYQARFLDKEIILQNIREMGKRGLKSVICAGEGEPLLNKSMPEIANMIRSYGVDIAMSTNGVLLTEGISQECLGAFTWIRFSVASLDESAYSAIQCGRPGDLSTVCANIENAVRLKRNKGLHTTLGVQCLALPQNIGTLYDMGLKLRKMGVDYFTIKPYSRHLHSENQIDMDYKQLQGIQKEVERLQTEGFKVYFRANAVERVQRDKTYTKCLGLPFMTYIDAKGNVWPCVAHMGVEGLCYGNLYEEAFVKIWEGSRRREVTAKINSGCLNETCRKACRLDEINYYLNELENPGKLAGFI